MYNFAYTTLELYVCCPYNLTKVNPKSRGRSGQVISNTLNPYAVFPIPFPPPQSRRNLWLPLLAIQQWCSLDKAFFCCCQVRGNVSCSEHNVNTGLGASTVSHLLTHFPYLLPGSYSSISWLYRSLNSMEQCHGLWFPESHYTFLLFFFHILKSYVKLSYSSEICGESSVTQNLC